MQHKENVPHVVQTYISLSILGIEIYICLYFIWKFFYIPYRQLFCLHYVQTKCPYAIQTRILLSITNIYIWSICHVDKSTFVHIAQIKKSISGIDKISKFIVHAENIFFIKTRNITYIHIYVLYKQYPEINIHFDQLCVHQK